MIFEQKLGSEAKDWEKIQVSFGNDVPRANTFIAECKKYIEKLDDTKRKNIERIFRRPLGSLLDLVRPTKDFLRLCLIKKFIDNNNLLVLREFFGVADDTALFIGLAKIVKKTKHPPTKAYVHCLSRELGSPATWQSITGKISPIDIKKLQEQLPRICRVLSKKIRRRYHMKFYEEIGNEHIFVLGRFKKSLVAKAEKHNIPIEQIIYSALILDIKNMRLGHISHIKREISYIYNYLRDNVFVDRIFNRRQDKSLNSETLFSNLLDQTKLGLAKINSIFLDKSNLPNSPSIQISETSGNAINEAIQTLKDTHVIENLRFEDVRRINYSLDDSLISVYSYGDFWERRIINIDSRGKQIEAEAKGKELLNKIVGFDIMQTKLILQNTPEKKIIEKMLAKKNIPIDSQPPENVMKLIVTLVGYRILKKPKQISKRKCFECNMLSWDKWECPRCGKEMVVVGKEITIEVNEGPLLKRLWNALLKVAATLDPKILERQRQRHRRQLLKFETHKNKIPIYIAIVKNQKGFSFVKNFSKDHNMIVICSPQMLSRKPDLEILGCEVLYLAEVIDEINNLLAVKPSNIKGIIESAAGRLQERILEKIFRSLRESKDRMDRLAPGYDDGDFETDIKNIFQSLVPNVVRLGGEQTGKSIPDGFCSYKGNSRTTEQIKMFGWDAKFTRAGAIYHLTDTDVRTQLKYIKWLNSKPLTKAYGNLACYAIITNATDPSGYANILRRISISKKKPRMCRIFAIKADLILELAKWILNNGAKYQTSGPEISKAFFDWIKSQERVKNRRWTYIEDSKWPELKDVLDRLS